MQAWFGTMEKYLCLITVLLSLLIAAAVGDRYNCYQCSFYDDIRANVKDNEAASKQLRNEIKFRSDEKCRLRDIGDEAEEAGCEDAGQLEPSCASGDLLTQFNFTYPVRGKKVPARVQFRLRFRSCYARRKAEDMGCRDVAKHQDVLKQQILKVVGNKPFKVTIKRGDVCLCQGHGCNGELPEREAPPGVASIPCLCGTLLTALLGLSYLVTRSMS